MLSTIFLPAVLGRLSPVVRSVVVMSPTPLLGFNGPPCLSGRGHWPAWLPLPPGLQCTSPLTPLSHRGVFALLAEAAGPYPNVHVVDLRRAICPGGVCRAEWRREMVYRNGQHLTASFAESLAPDLRYALQAGEVPIPQSQMRVPGAARNGIPVRWRSSVPQGP